MNKFRTLRADEIDCRVSQVTESGVMLLLYKDARCDQNILDDCTLGNSIAGALFNMKNAKKLKEEHPEQTASATGAFCRANRVKRG